MDFKLVSDYEPHGDQATAIKSLLKGLFDREQHQVLLGVTGSGKTYTMAKVIERVEPARAGDGAQQDSGGPALSRVQEFLSAQRGRIFRLLLRLLSAGGLRPRRRSLHRKRIDDQRRTRQAAAFGDAVAVRAARCA